MALEDKSQFLELFIEVTKTITSSLDPDELFDLIVRKTPAIFKVDAATIRLLDGAGRHLILQAACGLSDAYLNRGTIDTEEPVFKALKGEPMAIEDAGNDPRINHPEATRQEGIRTILLVPIPIRGEINGILRLLTKQPRSYSRDEMACAAALGEQCGIAIENARIFKEQQTQLNYFKAIHEIGKTINATYELDTILELVVTRLPKVMNLKAATIRLIETPRGKLTLKAAHGLSQAYLERGPLDEELATYYLKQGEPVVIPDARKDIHTIYHEEAAREGIRSILAVPVSVQDDIIGVLRLLTEQVRYFSPADINFAMAVGEQMGVAIQRALDYSKMNP
ncbi:GAF domain-containing protein [Desulfatitalea alkaliphila]|uniref:GAF domain-containing protein n=1 Tax=Desulfatitalea alkaliphila TaxID=2929485 RepID=A0AA41R1X2_9BACT|nr:GAF domain-containing protein [Desulfatitalea alkaliphila]MCJ8501064.1 GAF domain-containing protein [Desulfatitalea alkaliphila]